MNYPEDLDDTRAMTLIQGIMSGNEWNSDTLDVIAEIVRLTGREILDSEEYDDDVCAECGKPALDPKKDTLANALICRECLDDYLAEAEQDA